MLSGCVIDSWMVNAGYDYNKTKLDTGKVMVIGSIFYILLSSNGCSCTGNVRTHGLLFFSCTV